MRALVKILKTKAIRTKVEHITLQDLACSLLEIFSTTKKNVLYAFKDIHVNIPGIIFNKIADAWINCVAK